MRIMFDTNAFDKILNSKDDLELITACGENEYYITSIQEEELESIPDDYRRQALLSACRKVALKTPTPAIVGFSIVGDCMLTDADDVYFDLLLKTHNNVKDAMIGSAAKREKCTVVTNDKRFTKRLKQYKIPTTEYEDFIEEIKLQSTLSD